MKKTENRAVILDRDGTLFPDSDYLSDPSKIHVYKGVIPALKKLRSQGWKIIVGTNQSGIGRGYFSYNTVNKIHAHLQSLFRNEGIKIDKIYTCPHRPDQKCSCRKPRTGMLKAAALDFRLNLEKCIVVGDKKCDVDWGRAVGAKSVLVLTGYGRKASLATRHRAHHVSNSLAHAAKWILKQ